jgi:2-dehydropantoate 2-reductase
MSSKIVIFGSGGVGGYFGARLAAAGSDVTFVARGAHFEAMQRHGLRVISPLGEISLPEVKVVDGVAHVEHADFVFLTVKLWDTQQAVPELVPLAERGAAVISFQNGVQKDELLLKSLPARSVMGGVSYISAAIQEPGIIRHFGPIQNLVSENLTVCSHREYGISLATARAPASGPGSVTRSNGRFGRSSFFLSVCQLHDRHASTDRSDQR